MRPLLLLLAVWGLGLGALVAILALHQRADDQRAGQLQVERLNQQAIFLSGIAFTTSPGERVPVPLAQRRIRAASGDLDRQVSLVDPLLGQDERTRLHREAAAYERLMARIVPLRGRPAADRLFARQRAPGGIGGMLQATVERIGADRKDAALAARRLADIGSVVAILLLLAAFTATLDRALRARNLAECLATTDVLTGLPNRRRLFDREQDWRGAYTVGLFDLDGFKAYNDTFGHPAGDALLRRLSTKLARAVEGRGYAFRMGGDEFCLLTRDDRATDLMNAARRALSEESSAFPIRCSWGAATVPDQAGDLDAALLLADRRLYEDKERGRVMAGDGDDRPVVTPAIVRR